MVLDKFLKIDPASGSHSIIFFRVKSGLCTIEFRLAVLIFSEIFGLNFSEFVLKLLGCRQFGNIWKDNVQDNIGCLAPICRILNSRLSLLHLNVFIEKVCKKLQIDHVNTAANFARGS